MDSRNFIDTGSMMEPVLDTMKQLPQFPGSQRSSTSLDQSHNSSFASTSSLPPLTVGTVSSSTRRKRRPSRGLTIKRSASTPNVRGAAAEDGEMSLAGKGRNKLGYHRTSVACGHCRHRKIRCQLAADDPSNRCGQCIRLKKECNFFPVDQQPPTSRKRHAGSNGRLSSSSSSSPPRLNRLGTDQNILHDPYSTMPLSAPVVPPLTAPSSASIFSPSSKAPVSAASYEFTPHDERPQWDSPVFDQPPGHPSHDGPPSAYWQSPMTPGYPSPFTSVHPSLGHLPRDPSNAFGTFGGPRDQHWPIPHRSMSLDQVPSLPFSYQNQCPQSSYLDYRRRNSAMPPQSLGTSANSSSTSISELHPGSSTATLRTQAVQLFSLPAWSEGPGGPPVKAIDYNAWYSEPGHLAKVQEEDFGHWSGVESTALYSSAELQ